MRTPSIVRRPAHLAAAWTLLLATASCASSDRPFTEMATTVRDPAAPPDPAADETPEAVHAFAAAPVEAAVATHPAVRLDPPYTDCQRIAAGAAGTHPETTTQVLVRTVAWGDTVATVEVAERIAGTWVCGTPMTGRVGRNGVRPLLERRSGDGTTPAGVFPLATMTAPDGQRFSFFGNSADPGVTAGAYRRVQPGDCFGATPGTAGYGHLRDDTSCPGPDDEYLPDFTAAYSNAALIGANMEPNVSGDEPGEIPYASAIFLHRFTYVSGQSGATKPTSGCVSLSQADLTSVLVALRPGAQFVIGPTDWLLDQLDVSAG
ncbi:MAG: L,D-transpeptidase family protein [Ilumatobacteraceae bacterium]